MQRHPHVPWVVWGYEPNGHAIALNERTGERAYVANETQLHEFAARAARAGKGKGLGDLVAGVASALGIKKCAPCAKRQAMMNRWG